MADPTVKITGIFDDTDLRAKLANLAKELERLKGAVDATAPGAKGLENALDGAGGAALDAEKRIDRTTDATEDLVDAAKGAEKAVEETGDALDRTGKEADQAGRQIKRSGEEASRSERLFAGLTRRLAAAAAAYISIRGAQAALTAARTEILSQQRLRVALGDNIAAFEQIRDLTAEIQGISIFGDEQLNEVAARLLNAGVPLEKLEDQLRLVADVASATGISLEQIAKGIASFGTGTAGELGENIPLLRQLAKEGRLATDGIRALRDQFGGAAEQVAGTNLGKIDQAVNSLGDSLEVLGGVLAQILASPLATLAEIASDFVAGATGSNSFEGRIAALGASVKQLADTGVGDADRLRKKLEELREEIAALADLEAVGTPGRRRIDLFLLAIGAELADLELAAQAAAANTLSGLEITAAPFDFDALKEGIARTAAEIGRSTPQVETLTATYQELQQAVVDGSLSQEEASERFQRAIDGQSAAIQAYLTELRALEVEDDAFGKEVKDQIKALEQLDLALKQVAQEGFAGIAQATPQATTALESFGQNFARISEQAGSFVNLGADLAAGLANGISDLIGLFGQANASFSDFARNFISQILRMIAQQLIFNAISGFFVGGGSAPSSTGSGAFPSTPIPGGYSGGLFTGSGFVSGPDVGYDNVNAKLAGGEYVIPSSVVRSVGPGFFAAVRSGAIAPSALRSLGGSAEATSGGGGGYMQGGPVSGGRGSSGSTLAYLVGDKQTVDRIANGDGRRVLEDEVQRIIRNAQ